MNADDHTLLTQFLARVFDGRFSDAVAHLTRTSADASPRIVGTLLRVAALQPGGSCLDYRALANLWHNLGHPALKPNITSTRIRLLANFTANDLPVYLRLFCAARGVDARVALPDFDAVETEALNPASALYREPCDMVLLLLSEHWLHKYLGSEALVTEENYRQTRAALEGILQALETHGDAQVLVANFPPPAYPTSGALVAAPGRIGRGLAVQRLNLWLAENRSDRVHAIDLAGALFDAGGSGALGTTSYLRARMAYEPAGTLALAREAASALAHLCGKSHRAVVSDWDNTLWGGEVADLGPHGIACSHDSPDGLGYRMVQEYLHGLKSLGVLLAAASRNDPAVASVFHDNPDLALSLEDFASVQVGFAPKSESVARIAEELGFGTEFMVFVDDSLFELAEALLAHPYLDVIQAGPEPQQTLQALARARIGNALYVSDEDLERDARSRALRKQREQKAAAPNIEEFLAGIRIKLTFAPLDDENRRRVLQMFQKTNQFNLTTRRHDEAALARMRLEGALVTAVSYEDSFGPQGVISVVVLEPQVDRVRIESWLMSCRVLNRTVEQAVFGWILDHGDGRAVTGECLPTEKNRLVQDLYARLGFEPLRNAGAQSWIYDPTADGARRPVHFAQIEDLHVTQGQKGE